MAVHLYSWTVTYSLVVFLKGSFFFAQTPTPPNAPLLCAKWKMGSAVWQLRLLLFLGGDAVHQPTRRPMGWGLTQLFTLRCKTNGRQALLHQRPPLLTSPQSCCGCLGMHPNSAPRANPRPPSAAVPMCSPPYRLLSAQRQFVPRARPVAHLRRPPASCYGCDLRRRCT